MKSIALGCDPNASALKEIVKEQISALGYTSEDYGSDDPIYANVAIAVAEAVAAGRHDRGILLCGTGIGVSIAANKVTGVRAALVSDVYSAQRAVKSNNSNIMTLGAQVTGPELAKALVTAWLQAEYETGTRSEPKVQRIDAYDRERNA